MVVFWVAVLTLRMGYAQESCFPYLMGFCDGDPQEYQCVQVTTDFTTMTGGEYAHVEQEICFMLGSPLFGGIDPAQPDEPLGLLVEVDKGVVTCSDIDAGEVVGAIRFDVNLPDFGESCPEGDNAELVAPIVATESGDDFVTLEVVITEASEPIKTCVLTYDPTDEAHNDGRMLEGELNSRPGGGFSMRLQLAELKQNAICPGLEHSDLCGTGSPVPLFFDVVTKDNFFMLPPAGGTVTVTTTISSVNEFGNAVYGEFEESLEIEPMPGNPLFRRGDVNQDGAMNIADAIYILQNLFAGGAQIACMDAADANDDEGVNIADGIYILQHLFAGGAAVPAPHPGCGVDTTMHPEGKDLPACDYCAGACQDPVVPCP
jgi:hypothetical protein